MCFTIDRPSRFRPVRGNGPCVDKTASNTRSAIPAECPDHRRERKLRCLRRIAGSDGDISSGQPCDGVADEIPEHLLEPLASAEALSSGTSLLNVTFRPLACGRSRRELFPPEAELDRLKIHCQPADSVQIVEISIRNCSRSELRWMVCRNLVSTSGLSFAPSSRVST